MIDSDLVTHLRELRTAAGSAIFTGSAGQSVPRRYVVIRRATGAQPRTLGNSRLFARAQFDINVIAETYPDAYPIVNQILYALDGFRGLLGGTGGTLIQSCRCVSFPADQSLIDGDLVIRWVQSSYLFIYSEVETP